VKNDSCPSTVGPDFKHRLAVAFYLLCQKSNCGSASVLGQHLRLIGLFGFWKSLRARLEKKDAARLNLSELPCFGQLSKFYGEAVIKDGSWSPENQSGGGDAEEPRNSPIVAMAYCLAQFVYSEQSKSIFLAATNDRGIGWLLPKERLKVVSRISDKASVFATSAEKAEQHRRSQDEIDVSWSGNNLVSTCVFVCV
jgi:hypothetical protein